MDISKINRKCTRYLCDRVRHCGCSELCELHTAGLCGFRKCLLCLQPWYKTGMIFDIIYVASVTGVELSTPKCSEVERLPSAEASEETPVEKNDEQTDAVSAEEATSGIDVTGVEDQRLSEVGALSTQRLSVAKLHDEATTTNLYDIKQCYDLINKHGELEAAKYDIIATKLEIRDQMIDKLLHQIEQLKQYQHDPDNINRVLDEVEETIDDYGHVERKPDGKPKVVKKKTLKKNDSTRIESQRRLGILKLGKKKETSK